MPKGDGAESEEFEHREPTGPVRRYLDEFIAKKRSDDPQLRFKNMMWEKYFA